MAESSGQAIVVLGDTPYYESLENAMKIRKYVKQRNVAQLPKSVQDIIRDQQDEANAYDLTAMDALRKAIESAEFFVDGEHLTFKGGDAKSKIEQALEYLVAHVYGELDLITQNAESDEDIVRILTGGGQQRLDGMRHNQSAAARVEEYLEMQAKKILPTSMADIQSRYQAIPYGWREIDVAAVVAMLIYDQKVTVKYAGNTIQPRDSKLPDMLRKKSEIGKTMVSQRQSVTVANLKEAKEFLRDYFDVMNVPDEEDGMIDFIINKFTEQKTHYEDLLKGYEGKKYPDKALVQDAVGLMNEVLSQRKDNVALVSAIIKKENALYDNKDAMQNVEAFFKSQVQVFDAASKMLTDLQNELDYLSHEEEANKALNRIRLLVVVQTKFDYKCIPELNTLMTTVREGHSRLIATKREELLEIVRQCLEAIHTAAGDNVATRDISAAADTFYTEKQQRINELESLALLDGLIPPMLQQQNTTCSRIEALTKPAPNPVTPPHSGGVAETPKPYAKKIIKAYNRQIVFPTKRLETEADVDAYVEMVRGQLKTLMKNCDGIELK